MSLVYWRSEFAVHKLKKAEAENGMFLLRHSPKEFDKYFLTVCAQVQRQHPDWSIPQNTNVNDYDPMLYYLRFFE